MDLRSLRRDLVARSIQWSGISDGIRYVNRRGAAVLMYHKPTPAGLDHHLAYLRRRFQFTTLDAIVDAITRRDFGSIPERAVALTLDDGDRSNYALLPVFRRHGVRPTLYLCSQIVGTRRRFWWDTVADAEPYKRMWNSRRLEALKRDAGYEAEAEAPAEAERSALSLSEIAEMAPWVDFGAHTRFHPILTQCSDEEAWREIAESKRELEALLGAPVRHFCYPNGDYLGREAEYARRAGFASARTVDVGWNHPDTDPYRLKVLGVSDDASIEFLASQITGIPAYVRRALQGSWGGRWPAIRPTAP